jgi:hypothetical protein
MKYIIRLMAAIPMLGSGIATLFLFIFSFDYGILVIPTILSIAGFPVCAQHYEETVKDVAIFFEKMAKDALNYEN